ncbi:hypothetical protein SARC_07239 [Sphaeroforma arctica JP610]|uniref:Uncharacterized protein n=1 Tax=Sphaeroforma arctica JP610 TaxID=667725 RepID=A0A0L0FV05_9EUKA|nr:hypothetical protein SARC_07239 [Sphaeroforma arctica JP610]KNC80396.1 hypothetical protein SARC_07239 [Sphaeroforma arctica JP610]|eukprot:XP_014154298.1 hypothetical protein SARC_07239 [Sphaeroforma arctica JP610]
MSISDAAKGRFGAYAGKQKYGASRHEFLVDWNGVRMTMQNDRGGIAKDVYDNGTRCTDLYAILHQILKEELSSKVKAAVPTPLVSTEWTMAYVLMEARTTRMLLVNPAPQLKVLAESISNDHALKVVYPKEFKFNAFKAVLTAAWTSWLNGDWNLTVRDEKAKKTTAGATEGTQEDTLANSLMTAAKKNLLAMTMLWKQRAQAVACLVEPVLADTFVKADIETMLRYPVFGEEVMTKLKATEVDLRNFAIACYPLEKDRVAVESAYEAGEPPLVVKIQSDLLLVRRPSAQEGNRAGGVVGALGQVPGSDRYSGCHSCGSASYLERDCVAKTSSRTVPQGAAQKFKKRKKEALKRKWDEAAVVVALKHVSKDGAKDAVVSNKSNDKVSVVASATNFVTPGQE